MTSAPTPKSSGSKASPPPPPRARDRAAPKDVRAEYLRTPPAPAPRPRRVERVKPSGPKLKVSNSAAGPEAAARRRPPPPAKSLEAVEARLALGVDLAAVESFALVFVADDLVRGVELGKTAAAFGSFLLASGCSFLASLRKALLISASLAPCDRRPAPHRGRAFPMTPLSISGRPRPPHRSQCGI